MTPIEPAVILLETERLVLRRFQDCDEDAGLLLDLDSDPEVMRYIGPYALDSVAAYRERIRDVWLPQYAGPGRGVWAVHEKSAAFLGWIFIRPAPEYRFAREAGWTSPNDLELGYRFKRLAWGRGLCTEGAVPLIKLVFTDPTIERIVGAALATNRASTRVMEKIGMSPTGKFQVPGFADPCLIYSRDRL
jgi:RimJ/RimL family protein N-acetyltransferase